MSSPPVASSSRDVLPPSTRPFRALPRLPAPPPTRKPPPSPLTLPPSSSSPNVNRSPPNAASFSASPNVRSSHDSYQSDLASMRSDVSSLRCSEFPTPPIALPTIPASPKTPRSLHFSIPPSPRSRSRLTLKAQDPPDGVSIGSASSVKGIFPRSREQSPIRSKLAQEQPQESPAGGSSFRAPAAVDEESKLGYDPSRVTIPTNYSQYAAYKEANIEARGSQPPTPTTAGTLTPREWPSSSTRSSSPRPSYAKPKALARNDSPLKNNSTSAAQQDDFRETSRPSPSSRNDLSTSQSMSPKPPRAPLPVPPSERSSARYSHIARKIGVIDMGIDINEEKLLSTNFISELLQQPAVSSPRSGKFTRHPDSPRSGAFTISDDVHGLNKHVRRSELHLATEPDAGLSSPGLAPTNVSILESDFHSPTTNDSGHLPELISFLPSKKKSVSSKASRRRQSDHHQSFLTLSEDKVEKKPPSPALALAVPKQPLRSHGSPHPLVPTTPMTPESFKSGNSDLRFVHGQSRLLPSWRPPSSSLAGPSRLPIGPSPGTVMGPRPPPSKTTSSFVRLSKIRQRHYPRQSMIGSDSQSGHQNLEDPQSQSALTAPLAPSMESSAQKQEAIAREMSKSPLLPELAIPSPILDIPLSPGSRSDSTHAHDAQIADKPGQTSGADMPAQSQQASPGNPTEMRHSYETNFLSSESAYGDEESAYDIESKVQTASRVLDTTIPVIAKSGDGTGPTVVGTATAVVIRPHPAEPRAGADTSETQKSGEREATLLALESGPKTSPPPSAGPQASINAPPSARTNDPESAKSVYSSEDAHDSGKLTHLRHDEITMAETTNLVYDASQDASSSKRPGSPAAPATSFKSVVSYLTTKSMSSTLASKGANIARRSRVMPESPRRWTWLRRKPLPPLPPPSPTRPIALDDETANDGAKSQRLDDNEGPGGSSTPLELGPYQRSKVSLVQSGQPQGWNDIEKWSPRNSDRPYSGRDTTLVTSSDKVNIFGLISGRKTGRQRELSASEKMFYYNSPQDLEETPPSWRRRLVVPNFFRSRRLSHPRRCFWFTLLGIAATIAVFGAALGTAVIPKQHSSGGGSPNCSGNKTGTHCNLDATCVCPSPSPGTSGCPAPLARALDGLVPAVAQLFDTKITSASMALVLYRSQGTPVSSNCASQAKLIDVGPFLGNGTSPNRTQWAQAALLWNLFESGDVNATQAMQTAVERLPFDSLRSKDGIESDPSDTFTVSSLGYVFNFANQTLNPQSVTFKAVANPSMRQLAEVNSFVEGSLDRIYSFANASSTQRRTALNTYWQSVLLLNLDDLPTFLTAFTTAPILLPFDATATPGGIAISAVLNDVTNKTISFPPPLGCFPGLSPSQISRINTVESRAFGLPPLVSTSKFDVSCFPNHPVYGILDVLRTRLPFNDFRSGVAGQAAVLTSDASSRVVLHAGELLSALPGPNITDLSLFDTDPREYGTLSTVNHVALNWLQSFPNTTLATAAAKFLISSPSTPPSDTLLFDSTSIPTVEVALFGNIGFSDLSSFVSNFSTPSGGLFFGSPQGEAFRRWALQQPSSPATVAWSTSAFASAVVREGPSTVAAFNGILSVAQSLTSGPTNSTSVAEIVDLFNRAGLFST